MASTRTAGPASSSRWASSAQASTRCSQLSRTSSSPLSATKAASRSAAAGGGVRLGRLLGQPQGGGHGLGQQGRVAEGGQLDQPHPVRVAGHQPPGQLQGQAGLARPARPGHRDQPMQLDQLGDLAELLVPPDQAGQPLGQVVAGLAGRGLAASRAGSWTRIAWCSRCSSGDGSIPSSSASTSRVCWYTRQRVGLPARPVQRHHQLAPEPLPGRVGGHQPLQLPHQPGVAAGGQAQLGQGLAGGQAQLLQPGRLGLGPRPVGELGQRRAPPQPQRRLQQPGRPRAARTGPGRASATSRSNRAASTCSGPASST